MLVKGMMKGLLNTSYLNVLNNIHRSKVEVDLKERVKERFPYLEVYVVSYKR